MTTREVADELVRLARDGKFAEIAITLFSPNVVSIEPGAYPGTTGIAPVLASIAEFDAAFTLNSSIVVGPLMADAFFTVVIHLDATAKSNGAPFHLDKVAVYQVTDGKIVLEQFFYTMPTAPTA